MKKYSSTYWNNRYETKNTGWDIGYVSTPIKEYIDQLDKKDINILVPGAGNAYEVTYLYEMGFSHVFLLDFAPLSIRNFMERNPEFPESQIICDDFFEHKGQYDLIIEQTFFSSLPPEKRHDYIDHMHRLLKPQGKLVGLLFGLEFDFEGPPFGGTKETYYELFSGNFEVRKLETAYNSIKPRQDRELFFMITKR